MDMFGLFELAGLEVEIQEPEKRKEKVKKEKTKKEIKQSSTPSKKYQLPIKLWYNDGNIIISATEEKKDMENKEIYQYIKENFPMLSDYEIFDIDKGEGVLIPKKYLFGEKGALNISEEMEIYLGTTLLDRPALLGEVQMEEFLKALSIGPCRFRCVDNKEIRLIYEGESPGDEISLPLTLDVLGEEIVLESLPITKKTVSEALDADDESQEEDEMEPSDKKKNQVLINDLLSYIAKEKNLPQKNISLVKRDTRYKVLFKNANASIATAKKETMYDTSYTLSLGWTKIALNAEMFDGVSEVKSGEIIKFLSKTYPEYSKERTELVVDEKAHLIIAILKGSRKGVLPMECMEDDVMYRIIKTPVADVKVAMDSSGKGEYYFRLPKIPVGIFECIENLFINFTQDHNRELLVRLYFNSDKGYFIRIPNQKVSRVSIDCEENPYFEEDVLVADIHSHGAINCSFSATDNADETGERLYGVYYNIPNVQKSYRLGSGGYFLSVNISDITDTKNHIWPQIVYGDVIIH